MQNNLSTYVFKATTIRVIDGDTAVLKIDHGFHFESVQRIRLLGIDTPERGQKYYQEAKDLLVELINEKEVYVQTEKSDTFGRFLGHLFVIDETGDLIDVNQAMASSGYLKPESRWNSL